MPTPAPHDYLSRRITISFIVGIALLGFLTITSNLQKERATHDARLINESR